MEPQFPLSYPPVCQRCEKPCERQTVSAWNRNGNAGRPLYVCTNSSHPRNFLTWDDSQGIANGNPQCWCGFRSRRGTTNGPIRTNFYSCPVGKCGYSQDAPPARVANSIAVVGGASQDAEPRPYVDTEAQAVGMTPACRERRHNCCVVM